MNAPLVDEICKHCGGVDTKNTSDRPMVAKNDFHLKEISEFSDKKYVCIQIVGIIREAVF